jgi:hypothetical protein
MKKRAIVLAALSALSCLSTLSTLSTLSVISLCLLLAGCQTAEPEAPEPSRRFPVTFELASVVDGIRVDSISIEITINDGAPQTLKVDLVTGASDNLVGAKPGDAFRLRFSLFSGGIRIGQGILSGTLAADSKEILVPAYDEAAIAQVKSRFVEGQLLPADLAERFSHAVAGVPFSFRVDSVPGVLIKWSIAPGNGAPAVGSGHAFAWTPTADLAGEAVTVKVEAWKGGASVDARNWTLHVFAKAPQGRLSSFTTRSDTSARIGTLTRLSYSSGLVLRLTFASLDPARDAVPVAVDSVRTDNFDRPSLVRSTLATGESVDSAFSWSSEGHLIRLGIRQGSSVLVDSFAWVGNELKETRRYVNDSLTERLIHSRDADSGSDTLLTRGADGKWELARIFRLRYQGETLIEKTWYLLRNGWQKYRREVYTVTGLGAPLRYQRFREGESSEPEASERYFYDEAGLLVRRLGRDDQTGEIELSQDYAWQAPPAKRSAALPFLSAPAPVFDWLDPRVREAMTTLNRFEEKDP